MTGLELYYEVWRIYPYNLQDHLGNLAYSYKVSARNRSVLEVKQVRRLSEYAVLLTYLKNR